MSRRTLLLDVDATVLADTHDPAAEYSADKAGGDYERVVPPPDARAMTVTDHLGTVRDVFVRPQVIDALRQLADEGVDIVWNTPWLATPARLHRLAADLGLDDIVRAPDDAELAAEPTTDPLHVDTDAMWHHWRMMTVIDRVRLLAEGDDLVLADQLIDLSVPRIAEGIKERAGKVGSLIGGIGTRLRWGLDDDALRAWNPYRPVPPTWHRRPEP